MGQGPPFLDCEMQIVEEQSWSLEGDLNNTEKKAEFQRIPTGMAHGKPYSLVSRSVTQTNKLKLVTFPQLAL